jgi:hypothetical protein
MADAWGGKRQEKRGKPEKAFSFFFMQKKKGGVWGRRRRRAAALFDVNVCIHAGAAAKGNNTRGF